MAEAPNRRRLLSFADGSQCAVWRSIDDVVMGGRSRGELAVSTEGTALFRGEVSLEDGGGFSSVRSAESRWDLSAVRALVLRVRGDGRKYQLRLRDREGDDGVNHCADFEAPAGEWVQARIALDDLQPRFRGRVLEAADALDRSSVRSFGLLVGGGRAGSFQLELEWIDAELAADGA